MIQDYRDIIADQVRDPDGVLSTVQVDRAIGLAVTRYSGDRAREVVEDFAASDSGKQIDLPAGWQTESHLLNLEFPIGQDPEAEIKASVVQLPLEQKLSLQTAVTAGDVLRATYTTAHQVDAVTDTVPLKDRNAVARLAASYCACQLASQYAHDTDSTISADAVDHVSKSEKLSRQAAKLERDYFDHLGIKKNHLKGASAFGDMDRDLHGGGDRIFHQRRYR